MEREEHPTTITVGDLKAALDRMGVPDGAPLYIRGLHDYPHLQPSEIEEFQDDVDNVVIEVDIGGRYEVTLYPRASLVPYRRS